MRRWLRWFKRRPRSELEIENAELKRQLALAGLLVFYYSQTRKPESCQRCTPRPRYRWRTRHAPTEIIPHR